MEYCQFFLIYLGGRACSCMPSGIAICGLAVACFQTSQTTASIPAALLILNSNVLCRISYIKHITLKISHKTFKRVRRKLINPPPRPNSEPLKGRQGASEWRRNLMLVLLNFSGLYPHCQPRPESFIRSPAT